MSKSLKYPSLSVKLKAMYSNKLTDKDFEELSKQNTLTGAIYLLKIKFKELEDINEKINRIELEKRLGTIYINDTLKIKKYLNEKEKKLLDMYLLKHKINEAKQIFRNTINIDDKNNIEKFYNQIENSPYYYIFKKYKEENVPLDKIEVELDKYYFENMYQLAKKEDKLLIGIIGVEIDLFNITTIYRAKKHFNFNKDEILEKIVNIRYNLTNKKIEELINSNSFEEIKEVLLNTNYKNVFSNEFNIEKDKYKYLEKINKQMFNKKLFDSVLIYCFENLMEYQIKSIINIIETIRYKM